MHPLLNIEIKEVSQKIMSMISLHHPYGFIAFYSICTETKDQVYTAQLLEGRETWVSTT